MTYASRFPERVTTEPCAMPSPHCQGPVATHIGLYTPSVPICEWHSGLVRIETVERYIQHYIGLTKEVWFPQLGLVMKVKPNKIHRL